MLAQAVVQGQAGFKLQYQKAAFNKLRDFHVGIHCSAAFRAAHPAFMTVLTWVVDQTGWRKVKLDDLDKKKSIVLVAEDDPEAKCLQKKSKLTFHKLDFVAYLTKHCEAKDKSFFVAAL